MPSRRIHPLITVLLGAAALGACNGPGLGGGATGVPAGPFYISGKANVASGSPAAIGFASFATGAAADAYDLVVVDPPDKTWSRIAAAGTWVPMASVSQWTVSGSGLAQDWGPRFLVYAQLASTSAGTDAPLYVLDLGRTSSTVLPTAGTRFSTASTVSSNLCSFGQGSGLVLNDYPTPTNSWVTFRTAGPDGSCTTLDNQTIAIRHGAGSTTAPVALGLTEPVEAIQDSSGALTGAIELVHILPSDVGTKSPTLQVTDSNLNVVASIGTSHAMQGTGNTSAGTGRDFQSLGIAANSGVWLYRDANHVMAINLAAPATATTLFTLNAASPSAGDVLQHGKALFDADGLAAYVAVDNPNGTSYILRIDTGVTPPTATVVVPETAVTGIQLVGLTATTGYLVYVSAGQAGIKATAKSASNNTTPLIVVSLASSQGLDPVPPAVVGDAVYYTVADSSANPYRQTYSASFSSGGVSAPAAVFAGAGSCAVMVRPVYPKPVATIGTPAYGSVLLARGPGFCLAADAALAYAAATLVSVDASGTVTQAGQLPQLGAQSSNPPPNSATALRWVDFGYFFGEPGVAAPVDSPLQSGLPVLLELDGATSQSISAADVETFLPGSTIGPVRVTTNLQ